MINAVVIVLSNREKTRYPKQFDENFQGGIIMQMIKWRPMRDMMKTNHYMHNLFDDFFYPGQKLGEDQGLSNWHPVVDIYEEEDNIVVKAELPGVSKDGISVDVKDRVLTLKGERSIDNEIKEDKYFRRERSYGRFERAFTLPAEVNTETIKAEYNDGVLKISVPKPEKRKAKEITIH